MIITIPKRMANRLLKIYNDLDTVAPFEFNQNNCETCVIGHALQHGLCPNDRKDAYENFNDAVKWAVDGELDRFFYAIDDGNEPALNDAIAAYLFGDRWDVQNAADVLGMRFKAADTPKHAQKRIEKLLNKAGWEIQTKWSYI